MKRFEKILFSGLIIGTLLVGCGQTNVTKADKTTIEISNDGSIIQQIVEDFSEPYYDFSEMEKEINSEVSAFNSSKGKDLISIQDASKKDKKARVTMTYKDTDSYGEFNDVVLFMGKMKDAVKKGYNIPVKLVDSNKKQVNTSDFSDDSQVLILSEKISVLTSDSIVAGSIGTIFSNSKSVDLSKVTDEYAVLILN